MGGTENLLRMITDYVYQFRGEDRDQNRGILLLGMNGRMDGKTAVPTDWLTHQWKDRQNLRNKSPQRRLESVQLFSGDGWYLIYSVDRSSFLIRNHAPTYPRKKSCIGWYSFAVHQKLDFLYKWHHTTILVTSELFAQRKFLFVGRGKAQKLFWGLLMHNDNFCFLSIVLIPIYHSDFSNLGGFIPSYYFSCGCYWFVTIIDIS